MEINGNIILRIKENIKWKYNFKNKGKYEIKIVFKKILNNINGLFENCKNIYSIDLSNFNTSKVTDMGYIFNKCNKLKIIKGIEKFNTINVINMRGMFQLCNEIEELNLSNFNTSKVTDMECMFNECNKLKIIKGIEKLNTINVINMNGMFNLCNEIKELNLSNFNTSNVTDMGFMFAMFNLCNEIEELNLSNFNTSNVTDMEFMFTGCNKLKLLNIFKFNIKIDCITKNIFYLINKDKCKLICQDNFLNNLFYS